MRWARGVFLVLAAKAPARVWEVSRSESSGLISNITKKPAYVNHYHFHIMDPQWGHVTIRMSGHPPFGIQVSLNGHDWVQRQAQRRGVGWVKEGNCFVGGSDCATLHHIAEQLDGPAGLRRLAEVC